MLSQIRNHISDNNPWKDQVQYFDSITSTNNVLKQLARDGAPEGTVLIADRQTSGRGRLGRSFLSPANVGVYMSVLLRPSCRPGELMHLTCAAATSACDAIEKATGIRPGIKWTNDIVYRRRKLAGILTEMSLTADRKIDYAIIGIGINCCQKEGDFPEDIRSFAGSLEMVFEKIVDRAAVAAAMVDSFQEMSEGLIKNRNDILNCYRSDCVTLGQEVSVLRADTVRHGTAIDIDDEGALIVRFEDSTVETVNSGEVSVRGLYHYV